MKVWIMHYDDEVGEVFHVFDSEEKLDYHIDHPCEECRGRGFVISAEEVE